MRRAILLTLVLLLVAIPVVVAAGCGGGDTDQAKADVKAVQDDLKKIETDSEKLTTDIGTLLTQTDPAQVQAGVAQAKATIEEVSKVTENAVKTLNQLITLKGAEDYVKWAKLELASLEALEPAMAPVVAFLDQLPSIAADQDAKTQAIADLQTKATALQADAQKLQQEADAWLQEKGLVE